MKEDVQAIVCSACGGDPRRSVDCKECGGAGIGVPSPEGFLVWTERVDHLSIETRKIRRTVRNIFHFLIFTAIILVLAWIGKSVFYDLSDPSQALSISFWLTQTWSGFFLGIALLLTCFFIFRISEYTTDSEFLPNWGKVRYNADPKHEHYRFNISPYFSPHAREVIERAYELAEQLGSHQISSSALFASAVASATGSRFLIRLGLDFERFKEPIARLIIAESGSTPTHFSLDAKRLLAEAFARSYAEGRKHVSSGDVLLESFLSSEPLQRLLDQLGHPREHVLQTADWIRMEERMRDDAERFRLLARLKPTSAMDRSMTAKQTLLLDQFSRDLTRAAVYGNVPPLVGREKEMSAMLRALESGARAVVLIGPAGSGKMAIMEGLARRMVEERIPPILFDKRLVSVDVPTLIATGDPGLAGDRLLAVLQESTDSGNIVLLMQNLEALAGNRGPMELSDILANEIDRRRLIVLATVTPEAWKTYLERRPIASKCTVVNVETMNVDDVRHVLMARGRLIEYQAGVYFSYGAIDMAARLGPKAVPEMASPESALTILRESASSVRGSKGEHAMVLSEDVGKVITEKSGIPMEAARGDESQKLLDLENNLGRRVIGQRSAVQSVSRALRRARADVRDQKRPLANFLFLGPTGVGKTELAKALATEMFGSEASMLRFDMSEYQDASSIHRLIGAPGDTRGGLFTEAVRKKPYAIVLLDELEKAHPDVLTVFLQVMDDGRITDSNGVTVDCTNILLIATSNAGTSYIQAETSRGIPMEQIKTGLLEVELRGIFRPEFLNRFDGVIVFSPLSMDDVTQIAWLLLRQVADRLTTKGITFEADDDAVEEIAKAGFDPLYGARPLRRVIQDRVDTALADILLKNEVQRTDRIILHAGGNLEVVKTSVV